MRRKDIRVGMEVAVVDRLGEWAERYAERARVTLTDAEFTVRRLPSPGCFRGHNETVRGTTVEIWNEKEGTWGPRINRENKYLLRPWAEHAVQMDAVRAREEQERRNRNEAVHAAVRLNAALHAAGFDASACQTHDAQVTVRLHRVAAHRLTALLTAAAEAAGEPDAE